jgi:NADH:ubiquinone oxidoreductase subunit 2 (subunit N)
VIQSIYFKEVPAEPQRSWDVSPGFKLMLIITAALTIILGVYPELIIGWLYH